MANTGDVHGYLQAYLDSIDNQVNALRAPQAPQGGILAGSDPVLLSLAAGLLSPTRTGSFGESIGLGLQSAQGPLSEIRKQELARADKIATLEQARAKMALDYYDIQQGGRAGRMRDPTLNAKIWSDMATDLATEAFPLRNKPEGTPEKDRYNELMRQAKFLRNKAASIAGYEDEETPSKPTKKIPTEENTTEEPITDTGTKPEMKGSFESPSGSGAQMPPKKSETTGKTEAKPYTGKTAPAEYPSAKLGKDGYWYVKQGNGYARVME